MRRRFYVPVIILLVVIVTVYSLLAYQHPVPVLASQLTPATSSAVEDVHLDWPSTGQAAIGATGFGVLETHGTQQASPTASVAKVMNALAVLKAKPLALGQQGPTLTLTQADVDSYNAYVAEDGSVAKVTAGERITEYQALEAILLPSADNVADTLARWAYGSIANYSAAANSLAVKLGMNDSHFGADDASGYASTTTSTAHDLVLLGETALKNPVIAQIVAKPSATVPVAGTVRNVNWLLGAHGINGIKTGNTNVAGGVYLFSAEQSFANGKTITIVGAIMAEPTLAAALNEAVPLLDSARPHFKLITLVRAGQTMGTYAVPWAGSVKAVASKSLTVITWPGQNATPQVTLDSLHAPVVQGAQVGTIRFSITPATVPVITDQAVDAPSLHWRLLHGF